MCVDWVTACWWKCSSDLIGCFPPLQRAAAIFRRAGEPEPDASLLFGSRLRLFVFSSPFFFLFVVFVPPPLRVFSVRKSLKPSWLHLWPHCFMAPVLHQSLLPFHPVSPSRVSTRGPWPQLIWLPVLLFTVPAMVPSHQGGTFITFSEESKCWQILVQKLRCAIDGANILSDRASQCVHKV